MKETEQERSKVMKISERVRGNWELFWIFFRIGAFTFGGGYAMIPLIQREVVEKKHWITDDDMLEIIAISESTPGPIAINMATFIGQKVAGVFGAFWATMGVVVPAFVTISVISFVLRQFQEIRAVRYAFFGIRAGVLALILKALWSMYRKSDKSWFHYTVAASVFVLVAFLKVNVLFVLIGCAVVGIFCSLAAERRRGR